MKKTWTDYVEAHRQVVEASRALEAAAATAARHLVETLQGGGKVIAFGNGGSAAQAAHLAGELVGRFAATRRPLPALALPADAATLTCIANDFAFDEVFARGVEALARPGDLVVGLTTSGRSANVVRGLAAGRAAGASTLALTGADGLRGTADLVVAVPARDTAHVQEVHLMLLHHWCAHVDAAFG